MIVRLALASLVSRRTSVLLTLLSIIISVSILLSVELIRGQVKDSFTRTVSGVDLIVGAPTGQLNLLLYSIFRIGNPTSGITTESVQWIEHHPAVDWIIPLSLGDTHQGYRVVGTTNAYFNHFKYGLKQPLVFFRGGGFSNPNSTVLGAAVARSLGYAVGDEITLSHGLGEVSFHHHKEHPFVVSGILEPTGTPVDQAVHVTLSGIASVHASVQPLSLAAKTEHEDEEHDHDHSAQEPAEIDQVTAALVGLNSRVAVLQLHHQVNQYQKEPLLAILPGVALNQLWQLMGNLERLLLGISVLVLISSLVALITLLLATMRERRSEFAVLRAIGAGPTTILLLIQAESLLIAAVGCAGALLTVGFTLGLFADFFSTQYGLFISANVINQPALVVVGYVMAATYLCSFVPAVSAYRQALHAGLNSR